MNVIKTLSLFALSAAPLYAGGVGGAMPWENPLSLISQSLAGPTAAYIGVIGIMIAGGAMIFAHDLNQFGLKLVHVALAGSIMLLAAKFVLNVFGVSGALV